MTTGLQNRSRNISQQPDLFDQLPGGDIATLKQPRFATADRIDLPFMRHERRHFRSTFGTPDDLIGDVSFAWL